MPAGHSDPAGVPVYERLGIQVLHAEEIGFSVTLRVMGRRLDLTPAGGVRPG